MRRWNHDPIIRMIRNGYSRLDSGEFVKMILVASGNKKLPAHHNSHVERILRDRSGQIIKVETQKSNATPLSTFDA